MNVLVTGATGYIGSHTVLELLNAGHQVVALDNLSNSSEESLHRVATLTQKTPLFVNADIRDDAALERLFAEHRIDAVMHFAGLKAVGESAEQPLRYYANNVSGTVTLARAMAKAGVYRMIFSSSATVYGDPQSVPIPETAPIGQPTNPYGRSKLMIEQILVDLAKADSRWSVALLRYFNPVGAHPSGLIGEDPRDIPNNLVPFISQVAVGRHAVLSIFGDDYPTPDGTGVRDYIHVVDLARGHVAALRALNRDAPTISCRVWNLGTGQGYSVKGIVAAFEKASGQTIPVKITARRPGDIAECYADARRARDELGWQPEFDLNAMMRDAWHWQQNNPQGYA